MEAGVVEGDCKETEPLAPICTCIGQADKRSQQNNPSAIYAEMSG